MSDKRFSQGKKGGRFATGPSRTGRGGKAPYGRKGGSSGSTGRGGYGGSSGRGGSNGSSSKFASNGSSSKFASNGSGRGDGRDERVFREADDFLEDSAENLMVYGKNPVYEALQAGAEVNRLLVVDDSRDHTIQKIIDICKERKHPIRFVDRATLDRVAPGLHQGVVLYQAPFKYVEVDDILALAEERGEDPLVIILSGITDPHNLGAILRTAEAAGAHGVIIPKRGGASVGSTALKVSSGAAEYIKVARVSNISKTMDALKEKGLWIVGTSPEGDKNYTDFDLRGPLGIVIGSEGSGMPRLVTEKCDAVVRIDMYGRTESLNASVSAGIMIFEALRQRKSK